MVIVCNKGAEWKHAPYRIHQHTYIEIFRDRHVYITTYTQVNHLLMLQTAGRILTRHTRIKISFQSLQLGIKKKKKTPKKGFNPIFFCPRRHRYAVWIELLCVAAIYTLTAAYIW